MKVAYFDLDKTFVRVAPAQLGPYGVSQRVVEVLGPFPRGRVADPLPRLGCPCGQPDADGN